MTNLKKRMEKELNDLLAVFAKVIKDFSEKNFLSPEYQDIYSKSILIIKQLMPERLDEFKEYYKVKKKCKNADVLTYGINDYLIGFRVSKGNGYLVEDAFDHNTVIQSKLFQQFQILISIKNKFNSLIWDIEESLQSNLLDNEILAAETLLKSKYIRSAGTVAGVVLESHLSKVCDNHNIKIRKKKPGISDYNNLLKNNKVIDTPIWRLIQRLEDIRNYCTHKKERDPTFDEVEELIINVQKIIKTLF
ncbi:MAG: hypothetical protein LBR15_07255 [Methanobrevibacter sp.]|jgi:hypothetical protein|nr:hypothetical protein [Candidatus Methanovirga australis]